MPGFLKIGKAPIFKLLHEVCKNFRLSLRLSLRPSLSRSNKNLNGHFYLIFYAAWIFLLNLLINPSAIAETPAEKNVNNPVSMISENQGDFPESRRKTDPSLGHLLDNIEFKILTEDPTIQLEKDLVHLYQSEVRDSRIPYLLSILYQNMPFDDPEERQYYLSRAAFLARQSYELDKKSAHGYAALARLLFLSSQREKSLGLLDKIYNLVPADQQWILDYHEAFLMDQMNQPEESILKVAQLMHQSDPLGVRLAVDICKQVCLKINPNAIGPILERWRDETRDPNLSPIIGKNFLKLGKKNKARQILLVHANQFPNSSQAALELADNYLQQNPVLASEAISIIEGFLNNRQTLQDDLKTVKITAMNSGKRSPYKYKASKDKASEGKTQTGFQLGTTTVVKSKSTRRDEALMMKSLGEAWLIKGSPRLAEIAFMKYILSDQETELASGIIKIYQSRNYKKSGLKFLDKVIELFPGKAHLYALRGELASQETLHFEDAAESYLNAIALKPEETKYYNSLGLVYFKMKKFENAIEVFEKSIVINAQDPHVFYNLACAQALSGRDELAINSLEKAIHISPELSFEAIQNKNFDSFRNSTRFQSILDTVLSH